MSSTHQDATRLSAWLGGLDRVVIAFSGGVDSSVVAAASVRSDLSSVIAVTADSPSVARWQIDLARQVAAEIGIEHQVVRTGEVDRAEYRRNDGARCFHCKETLYAAFADISRRHAGATIVSGTNADDLGDYRPGIEAGRIAGVRTPLAELEMGKSAVRKMARHFGLSNHDLPASPCLASRIAYGTEVTPDRLARVERAEGWLRARGFVQLRVRLHAGELARIEVPRGQLPRLLQLDDGGEMTRAMQGLGFQYVTVDLQGFESGSMNRVVVPLGKRSQSSDTKEAAL
jgi:uncharacterized protein